MKPIFVSGGFVAWVDDIDYPLLSRVRWHLASGGYVSHSVYRGDHRYCQLRMHKLVALFFGIPVEEKIDHVNGNRLDNRRSNLRQCTKQQNCFNRGKNKNNTSGYKGVFLQSGKYIAKIRINNHLIHLGSFLSKEDAAIAYNEAASKLFGNFAWSNSIYDKSGISLPVTAGHSLEY